MVLFAMVFRLLYNHMDEPRHIAACLNLLVFIYKASSSLKILYVAVYVALSL